MTSHSTDPMDEEITPWEETDMRKRIDLHAKECAGERATIADLLAALEFTLKRCEDNGFPNGDLAVMVRAAIRAATGESA